MRWIVVLLKDFLDTWFFSGIGRSEFQELDIVLLWILAFFLIQGYGGRRPGAIFFDGGPLLPDERRV